MIYREAGQFKTTYARDQQGFPIRQDRLAVAVVFGLPSLRIKGFYLAVATLACQFFVLWALQRIGWFTNHSASGVITAQKVEILGVAFDTPGRKYMLVLCIVAVLAMLAKNMLRSET